MTFKEFLLRANKLAKMYPELLDKEVVYASDDEGNNFQGVVYPISGGYISGEGFSAIASASNPVPAKNRKLCNAVCIN